MKARPIADCVHWLGAVDWNRRLFDALIPLPDGTSYNAYLVQGSEKTALLDTVDPTMEATLMAQLAAVPEIHFVVSHHAEQDHSGALPAVLRKYPDAQLLCSPKAKPLLLEHLHLPEERIRTVADGETLSLGDRTLRFLHTPWVHWPETMMTYLPEAKILFSCDLFGSHLATTELFAGGDPFVCEAAKRYYAEIMMPFRGKVKEHLAKLQGLDIAFIAPSHGPVYDRPECILAAHQEWVAERVANLVVLPYISMHGSTAAMACHLVGALAARGVKVQLFDLAVTDLGKLAIALVDAATIVIGTPTVHVGPHPAVVAAAHLANALRPKLRHAAVIGSYGWATKAGEQIAALTPNLKAEFLGAVLCKGCPRPEDFAALDALADQIQAKHTALEAGSAGATGAAARRP